MRDGNVRLGSWVVVDDDDDDGGGLKIDLKLKLNC